MKYSVNHHFLRSIYVTDFSGTAMISEALNKPRFGLKWIGGSSITVAEGAADGLRQHNSKKSTTPSVSYRNVFLMRLTILGGVLGAGWRDPVKLDRTRKVWYLLWHVFWLLLPRFNFWRGGWALGYVSTQIWDAPNISLFPKTLSLKLFGNSYTKFAILDITFRFTCG